MTRRTQTMMPAIYPLLNQQYMTGQNFGQQGMFAEMQYNYAVAAQNYDQAIAWFSQSMTTAQQSGVPISDPVYYAIAFAHFSSARVKSMIGMAPMANFHLNQSIAFLNQAIALNPYMIQYHVAAGTVMMALGNLPEAERAFLTALQMNPSEPWSQYMLGIIHSARGNATMANNYFTAVQQMAPNVPQMPALPSSSPEKKTDWLSTVNNVCTSLNNIFKTIGGFQDMMQKFQ